MRKFVITALCIIACLFFASQISGGLLFEGITSNSSFNLSQILDKGTSADNTSTASEKDESASSSSSSKASNCAQLELEILQGTASKDELQNSKKVEAYLSSEYYPYYASLDSASKFVYQEILSGLEKGDAEITIKKGVSEEKTVQILTYIFLDHPQLFWCTGSCSYQFRNDKVVNVSPEYNSLVQDLDSTKSQIENLALAVVNETEGMDEFEAERYFHDYLCQATMYQSGQNDRPL